ncbi:hypothetical protein [Methylobacterium sp. WL120]|uniref:hypothetical protein n=1 Tax=Methylobacterium sp. WL120 TaxID=2603887 RepID=UPI0011CA5AF2|nr:hypothetical protein [Methylobacterium sp. WL120]TXM64417.1 hypothetical protein FV229_18700 [Methylobacterium sp. WL120]
MAGVLTVTSVAGLELVDHRLTTQYGAMMAQIRQRLSPDHAFLFARPEPALEAERLAWFTTVIGLFEAEVIHRGGPWRSFEAVEYATLARLIHEDGGSGVASVA